MRHAALLCALCLALAIACPAANGASPFGPTSVDMVAAKAAKEPLGDLLKDVEHQHPAAMFILAKRLFDGGRRDEAVFWFYEGQLRWRALIRSTNPGGQPIFNGEQDHFDVLFSDVGPDINQYAFGDIPALRKTIDSVLNWDAAHPDDMTPSGQAKDDSRDGLKKLKDYLLAHQDEIAKKRTEDARIASANSSPDDPYSGSGGALMGTPAAMMTAYDPKYFAAFRIGRTTKSEVVQALGKPELWYTDADGSTHLSYGYHMSTQVSAMLGMVQRVSVSFKFDAKRILVEINLPKGETP
jgi:hypothetical protein